MTEKHMHHIAAEYVTKKLLWTPLYALRALKVPFQKNTRNSLFLLRGMFLIQN